MALGPDKRFVLRARQMSPAQADLAEIDVGLRAHMLRVYNYMASGLALTGTIAYIAANTPAILQLLYAMQPDGSIAPTILGWAAMLSPLVFILVLMAGLQRMKASTVQAVFWGFAAVMGLSMAHIFLAFTGTSIARVFFITSGTFAAMSLYGYTTKRDLSGVGSFMTMGLYGIIIAMIVNWFLQSAAMHFVISVVGVIVFVGLTAWDTQKIKLMYLEADHEDVATKKAVMGAAVLYLDFINLFLFLLRLFGERR